jgi:hypothetical protein
VTENGKVGLAIETKSPQRRFGREDLQCKARPQATPDFNKGAFLKETVFFRGKTNPANTFQQLMPKWGKIKA